MNWQRNALVENEFYRAVKEIFGEEALAAPHPTWWPYQLELWSNALAGGRVNYHPLFPADKNSWTTKLLADGGKLLRAECRVRLLNFISTRPVDCPVAMIFSHPRACNWGDSGAGGCYPSELCGRTVL